MPISPPQHQKDSSVSFHTGCSGSCSVSSYPQTRLLAALPLSTTRLIQNAAARLVFILPKFSRTTPLLHSLHRLPPAARIRLKTLMLAHKSKNGPAKWTLLPQSSYHRTVPRSLRSFRTARLLPLISQSARKTCSYIILF